MVSGAGTTVVTVCVGGGGGGGAALVVTIVLGATKFGDGAGGALLAGGDTGAVVRLVSGAFWVSVWLPVSAYANAPTATNGTRAASPTAAIGRRYHRGVRSTGGAVRGTNCTGGRTPPVSG